MTSEPSSAPNPSYRTGPRWPVWLVSIGLIGFAAWLAFSALNVMRKTKLPLWERYRDFYEFYSGAEAFANGISPYLPEVGKLGYIYPPLLAFVLQPLTTLSIQTAGPIWLALNVVMLALVLWLGSGEMIKRIGVPCNVLGRLIIIAIAAALIADKVRSDLNMGQTQIALLLCWILALRWMDRRPLLAGLALGFASNIKYVTLIALPYFLIRRRWKAAISTVVCSVLWALLPAVQIGWSTNIDYLKQAFGGLILMVNPADAAASAARVQPLSGGLSCSITSMAVRVLGTELPASLQRSGNQIDRGLNAASAGAVIATMLLLGGVVWWMYFRARTPFLRSPPPITHAQPPLAALTAVEWAGLLLFILAFSPQTNMRHLALLLPTALCMSAFIVLPIKGLPRWPVILGALLMVAGLIFPPGGMVATSTLQAWRGSAGPIWCALAGFLLLLLTALGAVKRSGPPLRLPSAP